MLRPERWGIFCPTFEWHKAHSWWNNGQKSTEEVYKNGEKISEKWWCADGREVNNVEAFYGCYYQ